LPILLEDVPLCVRAELIFQHDGAPPHFSRQTREILNGHYLDRWIDRGGPIHWPARSPDLNVLDYFVWGHVKDLIEHRRDGNEDENREAILAAFNTITPEMAHRATDNIVRRAELCLRERGRTLQTIFTLKYESGLNLLGIPLKKKCAMLSTARWCGNDSNHFLIRY